MCSNSTEYIYNSSLFGRCTFILNVIILEFQFVFCCCCVSKSSLFFSIFSLFSNFNSITIEMQMIDNTEAKVECFTKRISTETISHLLSNQSNDYIHIQKPINHSRPALNKITKRNTSGAEVKKSFTGQWLALNIWLVL